MESSKLSQTALRAMTAGDMSGARDLLLRLVAAEPKSISGWLNLAAVGRQLGDLDGAHEALRAVLRLDNRNFPALLMQAALLERQGRAREAAAAYGIAVAQAPEADRLGASPRL